MMTSIDLSSSSKNGVQTSFSTKLNALQPSSSDRSYIPSYGDSLTQNSTIPIGSSHHSRHPSSSFSSSSRQLQSMTVTSEAGRLKTEQVMIECFYKLVEVILQSRVHLLLMEPSSERRNRRARFNLDIEEISSIREEMKDWKENIYLPLTIEIMGQDPETQEKVLLEQWSVVYVATSGIGNTGDVMQQLKDVVKKISVLLRALHSFLRQLPAHRFVKQHYPSSLSYSLETSDSNTSFQDVPISRYSFIPIHTPFGFLKVSTVYRRDCSLLEINEPRSISQTSMLQDNVIIQDYVPASPEQEQMAALASAMSTQIGPRLMTGMVRTIEEPPSPTRIKSHRERMIQPMSPRVQGDRYSYTDHTRPQPIMEERPIPIAPVTERRGSKLISQPMAIPHQIKPTTAPSPFEEDGMEEIQHQSMMKGNPIHPRPQHPHSYADPEHLRAIGTNPNITAAPYGYGNAVIEHTPPPIASGFSSGSGGNASSLQDSSPLPLSTPPRHPHSVLTPRTTTGRLLLTGKNREGASSLENFVLDGRALTASPSPTLSNSIGRNHSLQFTDQSSSSVSSREKQSPPSVVGTSPQLTPPFMAIESPSTIPPRAPLPSSAALVLRSSHSAPSTDRNLCVFSSSPPFQANPTELLSTSPGYAFSKRYRPPVIQRRHTVATGPSPTALVRTNSLSRGAFETSETSKMNKTRTFSADLYENSVGIWGISPDSPDTFGLAIASTRRGLLGRDEESTRNGSEEGEDLETSEVDMMMLPFAIGDVDSIATTTTSSEGTHEQDSPSTILSWDTASVGSFLQQLKYAPRLQIQHCVPIQPIAGKCRPPSLYDTELEQFRQLRDTLTHSTH